MNEEIRRVGLRMNKEVYAGYEELAKRYGMPVSSLMVYVLGQWLDNQLKVQSNLIDKISKEMVEIAKSEGLKLDINK